MAAKGDTIVEVVPLLGQTLLEAGPKRRRLCIDGELTTRSVRRVPRSEAIDVPEDLPKAQLPVRPETKR
jgi:hypothetical protein